LETAIFEYQFIIANISTTVRRIISKIRRFIEIGFLFILLNDNEIKFWSFEEIWGPLFFGTQCSRPTMHAQSVA